MNGRNVIKIGSHFERIIPLKPTYYESYASEIYGSLGNFDVDKFNIEPLKVIKENPKNISQTTGREWKPWSSAIDSIGKVTGGDWDTTPVSKIPDDRTYPKEYESHDLHQAFVNHFNNGVDWENTQRYGRHLAEADSFAETTKIKEKLKYYDTLYNKIRKEGYKAQTQLCNPLNTFIQTRIGEVLVDIGRNGELLFVDGRHRLSIAKILELDEIPVFPLVRHKQWCINLNLSERNKI